jgi:cysteine desulfuration protein SufE
LSSAGAFAAAGRGPQRPQQGAGLRQPGLARDHRAPNGAGGPALSFVGDSDAHIVRGLIAILFALYSGKTAKEILSLDPFATFNKMGLREHLTPQRSNGLRSMVNRIRADASAAQMAVS